MRPRDLAIVAAVLVLGGFALADALRGDPSPTSEPPPPATTARTVPVPALDANQPAIQSASGALVYTDLRGKDCRLGAYTIAAGSAFQLPPISTNCHVWAPLRTSQVAYGLPTSAGDATTSFRLIDLAHPERELGARFETSTHTVEWAYDGQRLGWCDQGGQGIDYDPQGLARRVAGCPVGYTPDDRPMFVNKAGHLQTGKAVVYRGIGQVTGAHWGDDGSLAVYLDWGRVVRIAGDGSSHETRLDAEASGRPLGFAPNNCAALSVDGVTVRILDLGCFAAGDLSFPGTNAAWSPDGAWIAIARPTQVLFQRLLGGDESATWEIHAGDLAWLR
jgi:hypothetical protein